MSGKPPKQRLGQGQNDYAYGGGTLMQGSVGGDDNILDLLGESKDRGSQKGSQHSMAGANLPKAMGSIEHD